MDVQLRGSQLPSPRFRIAPLAESLRHVHGFTNLQTFFPTLTKLYRLNKHQSDTVWLDSKWRMASLDISGTSGSCRVGLIPNLDASGVQADVSFHPAFLKVTHLLDPVRWIKGRYSLPKHNGLPWHNKTWASASLKLQDPWNQAYVESLASYALGRLREAGISPHFNEFYGAFCARAGLYRYNLTEEFGSFRNARWFWQGRKRGLFSLCVRNGMNPSEPVLQDIIDEIMREPEEGEYASDSESSEEIDDSEDEEVHVDVEGGELASIHSDEMSDLSYASSSEEDGSDKDSEEDSEEEEDYKIYAELRDFPVMLIAVEENRGTMDDLMGNEAEVGASVGTPQWEEHWSAWLFQVIAALSVAQALLGLTHNDLHTNNIVWTETKEEYLWYRSRAGAVFRVPTFGKLFRIIDFGRAIFTINGRQFISDDFRNGNDAEGQYHFKPLNHRCKAEDAIPPNPSFDLSRLSVSMIETIFPEAPKEKENGEILSSEEGVQVRETVSPLYNTLWSWVVDDDGINILVEPDGEERFPDFSLYKHIAAKIHSAVPAQQFSKPAFDRFQVLPSEAPKSGVWNLFA